MHTRFGELTVADAHAHFFSHRFFATLAAGLPSPPDGGELFDVLGQSLPFEFPDKNPETLAARWVGELDRHGVSRVVLIASVPGDEASVAAAARAFPDRVIPYFLLNPKAPDALERTERAFRELGMKGLCLFPAMHHFHVAEDTLKPILEEVAAHRGIVFVHCGRLVIGVRDKLGLPSPFDMSFARPRGLENVALAFDTIPFVVPHFGCDTFEELLDVAATCPNIFIDTSSSNAWMASMPEPLTLPRVFERTLEVMGAERILYGSDSSFFPRGWQRDHFRAQLEAFDVTSEQAAAIFGGNLSRLAAAAAG